MKNTNQDLLDLCTLNQLRDANEEGILTETEKEQTGGVIDWKIRRTTREIINKEKKQYEKETNRRYMARE